MCPLRSPPSKAASAAQAADEGRVLDELVSGGGDVVGRSLGDTAAKSAADFSKNPVGQAVDEVRVLKEVDGDGVTRLTRKQRQRLKHTEEELAASHQ